jgi:hypothetical protein
MRDLSTRLRDADPVHAEPGLTAADLRVIRQTLVGAARMSATRGAGWRTVAIVSAAALMLASAIVLERRRPADDAAGHDRDAANRLASGARRQLQFATPGGTRVIWVFDSRFEP